MINGLIGLISGVISGMGFGGGTILIPMLIIFEGIGQQLAQGINLMYFIPTGIIALVVHIRNKNFEAKTALLIGGFGVVGAVIGSWVAMTLSGNSLRKMFGIFLLIIGIYEIYNGVKERKT